MNQKQEAQDNMPSHGVTDGASQVAVSVDPVIRYRSNEGSNKSPTPRSAQVNLARSNMKMSPLDGADKTWITYTNPLLAKKVERLPMYIEPSELGRMNAVFHALALPHVPYPHEEHIGNIRQLAHQYIKDATEGQEHDSFYMVDLGTLVLQMSRWRQQLPMVHPFYAMKCNPNPNILRVLSALGAGFDCASEEEFMAILNNDHADVENIIFANPCKQIGQIKKARAMGLKYVTFDNEEELRKLKRHWPEAQCVLRIATNDSQSVCQFSVKFGCPWRETRSLLRVAHELGLAVVGVSFHVGSGCGSANVHVESAQVAREIFDVGAREFGFHMHLLDIGGGFLSDEKAAVSFEAIARNLAPFLSKHFADARIIAEPGRYFAEPVQTLVMNVYSKRVLLNRGIGSESPGAQENEDEVQLYVNDGVYHSFNCIIFDHAEPRVYPLVDGERVSVDASDGILTHGVEVVAHRAIRSTVKPLCLTTMYGPTCDSMDCLFKRKPFPQLEVGDWLVVPNFGAYTTAAAAAFNGFSTKHFLYMTSVPYMVSA